MMADTMPAIILGLNISSSCLVLKSVPVAKKKEKDQRITNKMNRWFLQFLNVFLSL